MVSFVGNRRPTTSILNNNTPGQDKWGITAGALVMTTTVTGSSVHKTVTVDGGNQGLCDKNPGKAASTSDTDAIVRGNDSEMEFWIDLRDNGAKSDQATVKGDRRPVAGKNGKSQARQGEFSSAKNLHGRNISGAPDVKSG
jgi:hypothetical protein